MDMKNHEVLLQFTNGGFELFHLIITRQEFCNYFVIYRRILLLFVEQECENTMSWPNNAGIHCPNMACHTLLSADSMGYS